MENYNQMDVPTSTAFDIFFNETSTRFLPVICLENIGELRNIAFKAPNAMVVFGIILAFLILVLILPHILYANRDEFPVFDKPSNKKRGWGCVVLFAFDDTEGIEKELKKEDRGQYWYTPYLSPNILYYYKYGKILEERRIYQSTGTTPHEFVLERYIPGNNLHNEIKKANKVYTLFDGIGIEKIDYIESFSAEDIARLEYKEINEIINRINKIPYP
ncbi:4507_t:CDS:2 [Rhizophagus irregularis]|nr:4507_t:CDS:2 [Rhizophagus irregularis]